MIAEVGDVYVLTQLAIHVHGLVHILATGTSTQGLNDQKLPDHGSSSSLSTCSVQSGCTEKAVDNLSMKEGRCDSILEGRRV